MKWLKKKKVPKEGGSEIPKKGQGECGSPPTWGGGRESK